MKISPIAIFAYKRPAHTLRLLNSLKKNELIEKTEIYVFCDGIKDHHDEEEVAAVKQVRHICESIDFCKKANLNFSDKNKGLASSIIEGISKVLAENDRIIVLEDDLELSPMFLKYMNSALDLYQDEEKVFQVSGYWYPIPGSDQLPSTFFSKLTSCWGWGTWARAWKYFEADPDSLKERVLKLDPSLRSFNFENEADFLIQLDLNINKKIKTWGIKWYSSVFLNNGLSLHSNHSYVNNTGHDGTGENCGSNSIYQWSELKDFIKLENVSIEENLVARKMVVDFFKERNLKNNTLLMKVKRQIPKPIKDAIKTILKKITGKTSKLNHE
jgi:hypothetical protein